MSRLLWPVFTAVAGPAALVLASASPVGVDPLFVFAGIPLILLCWIAAATRAAWIAAAAARRKDWARTVTAAILPVMVIAMATQPLTVIQRCMDLGDQLHFRVMEGSYRSQVAATASPGKPKLLVFIRGGMGPLGGTVGVVYDESDEVALPAERRSAAWQERAGESELACPYAVQPVREHFYRAFFWC